MTTEIMAKHIKLLEKSIPHCVFCLKSISFETETDTGRASIEKRFFALLERYLARNHYSPESFQKLHEASTANEFPSSTHFRTCEDCFKIIHSFCDLYHEFSKLELKMDWNIWKLKRMIATSSVPSRVESLEKYFHHKEDQGNRKREKFDKFRKFIVKECTNKLSTGFPRVSLTKAQVCQGSNQRFGIAADNTTTNLIENVTNLPSMSTIDKALISSVYASLPTVQTGSAGGSSLGYGDISMGNSRETTPEYIGNSNFSKINLDTEGCFEIQRDPSSDHSLNENCRKNITEEDIQMLKPEPNSEPKTGNINIPPSRPCLRTIISCAKCHKTFSNLSSYQVHQETHDTDELNPSDVEDLNVEDDKPTIVSDLDNRCESFDKDVEPNVLKSEALTGTSDSDSSDGNESEDENYGSDSNKAPIQNNNEKQAHKNQNIKKKTSLSRSRKIHSRNSCKIPNCREKFALQEQLQIHSKLHGEFKCNFCEVVESFAPDLATHELTHFTSSCDSTAAPGNDNNSTNKTLEGSFNCPRCSFHCTQKKEHVKHHLSEHLGITLNEDNACPICNYIISKATRVDRGLILHYKTHHELTGVDPTSIKHCTECSAYFLTLGQLDTHNRIQHKNDSLICKDCGHSFHGNRQHYRKHRVFVHKAKLTVECTVEGCKNGKFETQLELFYHIQRAHSKSKAGQCYTCSQCGKEASSMAGLKSHIRLTHEHEKQPRKRDRGWRRFVCEQCGKVFKQQTNLDMHYLTHAGTDNWEFPCSVCSKKCMTKGKLKEHMRTHTKEKPFVCQYCGTQYAHRHNLRLHVNSKHGDIAKDLARPFDKSLPYFTQRMSSKKKSAKVLECSSTESD